MDIAKIEKILSGLVRHLEEQGDIPAAAALPVLQCELLLAIYKKLESIDDTLITIGNDVWPDHHNK